MLEIHLQVPYTLMILVKNKCNDCDANVYSEIEVIKGGVEYTTWTNVLIQRCPII